MYTLSWDILVELKISMFFSNTNINCMENHERKLHYRLYKKSQTGNLTFHLLVNIPAFWPEMLWN